ncbi:hypothetical protein D3C84_848870 [compost metagenome]
MSNFAHQSLLELQVSDFVKISSVHAFQRLATLAKILVAEPFPQQIQMVWVAVLCCADAQCFGLPDVIERRYVH